MFDRELSDYNSEPLEEPPSPFGFYSKYLEICTAEMEDRWKFLESIRPYVPGEHSPEHQFGHNYIKLHGSVDLVNCKNNGCQNYQKAYVSRTVKHKNKCGICSEGMEPYLIPPIQNKPIRDAHYVRRSWTKALELCQEAEQVVIWGYSLPVTDHWRNWLIRQVWIGNCKEIIIINPEVYTEEGKNNEAFVNRFCPVEKSFNKEINKRVFKNFEEYFNSLK